jgi:hypothetical protein
MEELFPLEASWIVALAAAAVAIIMLLRLARLLPGQNIVVIAAGLLAGEALLEFFLAKLGRTQVAGPMWCFLAGAALLWMAVVLSARRVGQFILRQWRRSKHYGIWLLAISAVLTGMFQFGWPRLNNPDIGSGGAAVMSDTPNEQESEADLANRQRAALMGETPSEPDSEQENKKGPVDPLIAALMSAIRGVGTVILLVGLAPWFIRKRPVPRAGRSKLAQQPENQAQQNAGEQTSR